MDILGGIFLHVLYLSLTTSILMIAYLLIKKLFLQRIAMRYHHIIWMVLIIRLLMPINIESSISIFNFFPQKSLVILETYVEKNSSNTFTTGETVPVYRTLDFKKNGGTKHEFYIEENHMFDDFSAYDPAELNENTIGKEPNEWIIKVFSRIWLLGMLLLTLFFYSTLLVFERKYKMLKKPIIPELEFLAEKCRKKMNIRKTIPIYLNDCLKTPCIRGVINPCIYLPTDIYAKTDYSELQYIILHEMAHYKRKDLIYNLATLMVALIHWFNPLLWIVIKHIRHDREIACDAYVMETIEEEEIIPYGMTLINLAKRFTSKDSKFYLVSFCEGNSLLERRIKMIKMFKKGSYRISIAAIIFLIIIGGVILTNPSRFESINLISTSQTVEDSAAKELEKENLLDNTKEEEPNYKDIIKDMLVLIDPGHGGDDPGAIYTGGNLVEIKEKDVSLEISLLLYNMLKESGINAELTRREDISISLENRMELVNQLNPSLFVSIHNNFGGVSERDVLTLSYTSISKDLRRTTGERAAQIIHKELVNVIENKDSEILEMSNRLKFSSIKIPAVIIEPAYIGNHSSTENLLTEEFKKQIALSIHDGIIKVLKEMAADIQESNNQSEEIILNTKGQWPVPEYSRISSRYGEAIHPISKDKRFHTGIDISAPEGKTIVAFKDGKVVRAGELRDHGKTIVIDHGSGLVTLYAHASKLNASVGDEVKEGQKIAEIGSTGGATGNHVHFEIWINGKHVNPIDYLR
ncbi:M56 family metallopeptidase [Clostridium formicaceticum]|uniref:Regulatory protein BlaR1 n=1 Tax=Clostridium formicaceticum TaxID=1497 RepID=A0AAC9RNA3_9CLOT|nr:M56 family metallopeptidase [Clostridium formicaceticum]AOY77736.1 hypothetical protein BJL90_18860 [Clostridium formicaceticum]ARE88330.1 Regulatory protein BlaR1 [Clostridium formicaceticum]